MSRGEALLNVTILFIKGAIVLVGFIPATLIYAYFINIIIPIAVFILLSIFMIYKNRSDLIINNIILHVTAWCSYYATSLNPGTDGTLSGLDKVGSSIFWACFFGLLTVGAILRLLLRIYK